MTFTLIAVLVVLRSLLQLILISTIHCIPLLNLNSLSNYCFILLQAAINEAIIMYYISFLIIYFRKLFLKFARNQYSPIAIFDESRNHKHYYVDWMDGWMVLHCYCVGIGILLVMPMGRLSKNSDTVVCDDGFLSPIFYDTWCVISQIVTISDFCAMKTMKTP